MIVLCELIDNGLEVELAPSEESTFLCARRRRVLLSLLPYDVDVDCAVKIIMASRSSLLLLFFAARLDDEGSSVLLTQPCGVYCILVVM